MSKSKSSSVKFSVEKDVVSVNDSLKFRVVHVKLDEYAHPKDGNTKGSAPGVRPEMTFNVEVEIDGVTVANLNALAVMDRVDFETGRRYATIHSMFRPQHQSDGGTWKLYGTQFFPDSKADKQAFDKNMLTAVEYFLKNQVTKQETLRKEMNQPSGNEALAGIRQLVDKARTIKNPNATEGSES